MRHYGHSGLLDVYDLQADGGDVEDYGILRTQRWKTQFLEKRTKD